MCVCVCVCARAYVTCVQNLLASVQKKNMNIDDRYSKNLTDDDRMCHRMCHRGGKHRYRPNNVRCRKSAAVVIFCYPLLLLLLLQASTTWMMVDGQILSGARSWSSLLRRAFDIGRHAKWNEFVEEQKPASKSNHQSWIDETKDPESPFYISMISSNIGSGGAGGGGGNINSRANGNSNISSSSSGGGGGGNTDTAISTSQNSSDKTSAAQSGLMNKLFSYAFSTGNPSRIIQTTKRPLITYINISNLEEHDSENLVKLNNGINLANENNQSSNQLHLLNNAEPSLNAFQLKRRLPECATQQVCSAHYVKPNHTQRLCECGQDFNWNCEELGHIEEHTIDLTRKQPDFKMQRNSLETYTQVKMCENLKTIKPCKTPTDWTIMALQSERTGKAHYVVVCKCPDQASFEGPFTHKHPPYARFPGIRVYGMLCNQGVRKSKDPKALEIDQNGEYPEFPWELAYAVINATTTQGFW